MIDLNLLLRLGFALACAIAAAAAVFWALAILPEWLGKRRALKAAANKTQTEAGVHDLFMLCASPEQRRKERERQQAEAEAET